MEEEILSHKVTDFGKLMLTLGAMSLLPVERLESQPGTRVM